jgi:putative Holliday junction resolvase
MPGMPEPVPTAMNASATQPMRRDQTFLAFDFGTRRVGVASGNTLLQRATPLKTISVDGDARFAAIARLLAKLWGAGE